MSDQDLHCVLTESSTEIGGGGSEKYHQTSLKQKWTVPIDDGGEFYLA